MANYRYRAADQSGRIVSGEVSLPDLDAAKQYLRRQRLRPIELVESGPAASPMAMSGGKRKRGMRRKAGAEDVLFFTTNLAMLLRSGLPLAKSMDVMKGMILNPQMTRIRQEIFDRVKGGASLSEALQDHRKLFGDLYISMIRAGEQGGNLEKILGELVELLERSKALRSSVISAMIYPSILMVISVLSVFLLLGFVVPQFESLFSDMGKALPVPTQVVVWLGHATADYGWVGVVAIALAVFGWNRGLRKPGFRLWRDRMRLRLPVIGELAMKYETTVFSRTLGTLLSSGVPIIRAIPIAVDTLGNRHIRAAMQGIHARIKEGARLSETLEKTGIFSDMAVQMLRVGEESGRIEEMLLELAKVYDDDVQQLIKRGLTLLEPVLILTLGTVIGAIITSILMGILSVNNLAM